MSQLTADDLAFLLATGDIAEDQDERESDELQRLTRRISGQYVDVIALYASTAFAGRATSSQQEQLLVAIEALVRLARASKDDVLIAVLADLQQLVPRAVLRGGNRRRDFMRDLRDWVLAFAEHLAPDDGERLRHLVRFERGAVPLLDELAGIRGIGPKRLERLYCAGLFAVDTLRTADPVEVAQVTGLPSALAEQVVEASAEFAERERRRVVDGLALGAADLKRTLRGVDPANDDHQAILAAARDALRELQDVLRAFEPTRENA